MKVTQNGVRMSRRTYLVFSWMLFAMPLFCAGALLLRPDSIGAGLPTEVVAGIGLMCLVCAGIGLRDFLEAHRRP